jgi:hypothetical protein
MTDWQLPRCRLAPNTLVKDFSGRWNNGTTQRYERLEMPNPHLERGRPKTLCLAAKPTGEARPFLLSVPLREEAAA